MEQRNHTQQDSRSIDFKFDAQDRLTPRSDLKFANLTSRLETDEKALQEWHSKIAEIRKNQS